MAVTVRGSKEVLISLLESRIRFKFSRTDTGGRKYFFYLLRNSISCDIANEYRLYCIFCVLGVFNFIRSIFYEKLYF